jgi:plastocyanin
VSGLEGRQSKRAPDGPFSAHLVPHPRREQSREVVMQRRFLWSVAAIALVEGCSSGFNHPAREVTALMGQDNIQHVKIVTHSYWFDPNRVVVRAGSPVEITVHNSAWFVPHNFTITAPESDITESADVGFFHRTKILRFTPSKPGEYEFYCHVDGHGRKHGMKGTLVVK